MSTGLSETQRVQLAGLLRPRLNRFVAHAPTEKQQLGLICPQEEILYGGAAGGGKSDWLLMGALEYVDYAGYSALLLRRTFTELKLEGGLLERAWEWLAATDAVPHDGGMRWTFGDNDPDSEKAAVLQFGYMEGPHDHERYQGSNWQYVGFDELTHFRERQYRYLFSRLRRPELNDDTPEWKRSMIEALGAVPLRMRGASNPGGPGHEWVKQRFGIYVPEAEEQEAADRGVDPKTLRKLCHRPWWVAQHDRVFVPARLEDNPHLDQESYEKSLGELDPTTRRQLRDGDWDAKEPGEMFRREWFEIVERVPFVAGTERVRYWDLAATESSDKNPNPDWTVGLKLARVPGDGWYVEDVDRGRWRSARVEQRAKHNAQVDTIAVTVWVEQEGGASGKSLVEHWQREVLPGYAVKGHPPSDNKGIRARPVASKAEAGMVKLVRGPWINKFLDELEDFPPEDDEGHDDQVDALSGAFVQLSAEIDRAVSQGRYRQDPEHVVTTDGEITLHGDRYVDRA
jgi:predicted phage terminase large subunit-like protein